MPRENSTMGTGGIFIPKNIYEPTWKITIEADDGTTYTVLDVESGTASSSRTLQAEFTRVATDSLGSFRITLSNQDGYFLRKFDGGEQVNIYVDYSDGTTRRFTGRIDNVRYSLSNSEGWIVTLEGRDYPRFADETIIIQFSNKNAINCIKGSSATGDEVDSNGNYDDGILYNSGIKWDTDNTVTTATIDTTVTDSFQNRSRMEILKEICERAELDFYIHYDGTDWLLRVFELNSITNTTERIAFGDNLVSVSEFGYNNDEVKNRITVYGAEDDNIISIRTAENTDSQDDLWVKSEVVTESGATKNAELKERAEALLTTKGTPKQTGRIESLLLADLNPGEMLEVDVPYCDILGEYRVQQFTHTFGQNGSFTFVSLTGPTRKLSDYIKEVMDIEKQLTPYKNLNDMKNGFNLYFEDEESDILNLSGCELNDGILRLSENQTTGTCTTLSTSTVTDALSTSYITECELRIKAIYFRNCTFRVSNNDGNTWETINPGVVHEFASTGKKLRLEITLNEVSSVSPEFESVVVLWK